jgi:hypothetical protein
MDAVEVADRDDGARESAAGALEASKDPQRRSGAGGAQPPICWRRPVASAASGVPG